MLYAKVCLTGRGDVSIHKIFLDKHKRPKFRFLGQMTAHVCSSRARSGYREILGPHWPAILAESSFRFSKRLFLKKEEEMGWVRCLIQYGCLPPSLTT